MVRILLLLVCACAATTPRAAAPSVAAAPRSSGDALFVAGRYAEAIKAYRLELQRGERVVEIETLVAIARLANQTPAAEVADELHRLERTYPRSRWGKIAGALAGEIDRGTVLRQAVMAAGVDLRGTQDKLDQLTQKLTEATAQQADQQAAIAALRDERGKLQHQVKDLEDRATAQETHIKELEAELAALKQVDMQRSP
jgi:chromosome segregation ATPase